MYVLKYFKNDYDLMVVETDCLLEKIILYMSKCTILNYLIGL